jgi:hypothetical protein
MANFFQTEIRKVKLTIPIAHFKGNVSQQITRILHAQFDGKCVKGGFVKQGSIHLLSNSIALVQELDPVVVATFECSVACPTTQIGQTLECTVKSVKTAGLECECAPFVVQIVRDLRHSQAYFEAIHPGDVVSAKIFDCRFEIGKPILYLLAYLVVLGEPEVQIDAIPFFKKEEEEEQPMTYVSESDDEFCESSASEDEEI